VHTLLLWGIRIGSIFLTPLLVAEMMVLAEIHPLLGWSPLIGFAVAAYLVAWKIDRGIARERGERA
jgi:uncharacterized membrane protein